MVLSHISKPDLVIRKVSYDGINNVALVYLSSYEEGRVTSEIQVGVGLSDNDKLGISSILRDLCLQDPKLEGYP